MKQLIWILATVLTLVACNNSGAYTKAEDAQDAARKFIEASLKGDYDRASFYMYQDSAGVNNMLLNTLRNKYNQRPQDDKVRLQSASIIVLNTENLTDSTLKYMYRTSYQKDTTQLQIVKANGEWVVDLKKTFIKE